MRLALQDTAIRRLEPPHLALPAPSDRPVGQPPGPAEPEPIGQLRSLHKPHYNTTGTARDDLEGRPEYADHVVDTALRGIQPREP